MTAGRSMRRGCALHEGRGHQRAVQLRATRTGGAHDLASIVSLGKPRVPGCACREHFWIPMGQKLHLLPGPAPRRPVAAALCSYHTQVRDVAACVWSGSDSTEIRPTAQLCTRLRHLGTYSEPRRRVQLQGPMGHAAQLYELCDSYNTYGQNPRLEPMPLPAMQRTCYCPTR